MILFLYFCSSLSAQWTIKMEWKSIFSNGNGPIIGLLVKYTNLHRINLPICYQKTELSWASGHTKLDAINHFYRLLIVKCKHGTNTSKLCARASLLVWLIKMKKKTSKFQKSLTNTKCILLCHWSWIKCELWIESNGKHVPNFIAVICFFVSASHFHSHCLSHTLIDVEVWFHSNSWLWFICLASFCVVQFRSVHNKHTKYSTSYFHFVGSKTFN